MKVKPNTTYTYSCSVGEKSCNWAWYDKDKKIIARPYSKTAISPANAKYLLYFSGITEGTALEDIKVQIEEGNEVTPYQPHKENSTIINMPMQLETVKVVKPISEDGALEQSNGSECASANNNEQRFDYIPVQPNDRVEIYNNSEYRAMNCCL